METMGASPKADVLPRRLGDFEILREIGRGGMGIVYEAEQVSLHRKVALKVLSSGLGLSSKAVLRFRREAEAAAKLHHTNIVPVYAIGEEAGTHFYAMELIDGPSLDRVVKQLRGQPTPSSEADPGDGPAHDGARSEEVLPEWVRQTIAYEPGTAVSTPSIRASAAGASTIQSGGDYFD